MLTANTSEELKKCFEYELSSIPLSSFNELVHVRKTQKYILYNVFRTTLSVYDILDESVMVVIVGSFVIFCTVLYELRN